MAGEEDASVTRPAAGGSILTRKTGPLPNWVWMAILLLAALVYSLWRRNQAAGVPEDGPEVEEVPGDQSAPPVFILPQNPQPTVPINIINNPTTPPTAPPVGVPPPKTNPPAQPKPPTHTTGPNGSHYVVTVAKYTSKNPPWNSTLSGIAAHTWGKSNASKWSLIWNDPANAALRAARGGDPKRIQPNDKIYVRKKL